MREGHRQTLLASVKNVQVILERDQIAWKSVRLNDVRDYTSPFFL